MASTVEIHLLCMLTGFTLLQTLTANVSTNQFLTAADGELPVRGYLLEYNTDAVDPRLTICEGGGSGCLLSALKFDAACVLLCSDDETLVSRLNREFILRPRNQTVFKNSLAEECHTEFKGKITTAVKVNEKITQEECEIYNGAFYYKYCSLRIDIVPEIFKDCVYSGEDCRTMDLRFDVELKCDVTFDTPEKRPLTKHFAMSYGPRLQLSEAPEILYIQKGEKRAVACDGIIVAPKSTYLSYMWKTINNEVPLVNGERASILVDTALLSATHITFYCTVYVSESVDRRDTREYSINILLVPLEWKVVMVVVLLALIPIPALVAAYYRFSARKARAFTIEDNSGFSSLLSLWYPIDSNSASGCRVLSGELGSISNQEADIYCDIRDTLVRAAGMETKFYKLCHLVKQQKVVGKEMHLANCDSAEKESINKCITWNQKSKGHFDGATSGPGELVLDPESLSLYQSKFLERRLVLSTSIVWSDADVHMIAHRQRHHCEKLKKLFRFSPVPSQHSSEEHTNSLRPSGMTKQEKKELAMQLLEIYVALGGQLQKLLDHYMLTHVFTPFHSQPLYQTMYEEKVEKVFDLMFIVAPNNYKYEKLQNDCLIQMKKMAYEKIQKKKKKKNVSKRKKVEVSE